MSTCTSPHHGEPGAASKLAVPLDMTKTGSQKASAGEWCKLDNQVQVKSTYDFTVKI